MSSSNDSNSKIPEPIPNPPDAMALIQSLSNTLSQMLTQPRPPSNTQSQEGFTSAMSIKLDGKNFYLWSQMLKMKLHGRDRLGHLDGSTQPKPSDEEAYKRWLVIDSQVKDFMINAMDSLLLGNFLSYSSAKEVWDAVCTTYFDGSDLSQILDIKRKLNKIKQNGDLVQNYYTLLQGLWKELDTRRPNPMECPTDIEKYQKIIQEDRLLMFLDGLDDKLDHIRASILQMQPLPKVEEAFALVRKEEGRQNVMLNGGGDHDNSLAMIAKTQAQNLNLQKKPNNVKKLGGCTHCHNPKHTVDQCFKLIGYPDWWEENKKKKQGQARVAEAVSEEQVHPTANVVVSGLKPRAFGPKTSAHLSSLPPVENQEGKCFSVLSSGTNTTWVIDSGATDHMTFRKEDLVKESTPRKREIINANGEVYPVTGAGEVQFSPSLTLSNTLLIPSLSTRLLSVGQLCEELNCAVLMYPRFCLFQDLMTKEIIGRGTRRGGLYHLEDMAAGQANLSASSSLSRKSSIWMWHRRLGHPSFGYLRKLYPSLFSGFENDTFDCDVCIKSKSHRAHFAKIVDDDHNRNPFDLIHSDVWGPSPVESLVGNRWFVLFVDDCTRMTWINVVKHKSEVPLAIKSFIVMIKTQFDKNVKVFRSDNGREFVNKTLGEFFTINGIIHETSCVGTPQQNGIAERKNRHILEVTRAMMLENNVPYSYWDHAVTSAVYLMNRLPSVVLKFQTPLQKLSTYTVIPSVLNIPPKVFGCIAYVHIQKHLRSKLDPCAEKCVFIGYGQHQKGYRCMNPTSKKIYTTMDVTFIENEGYFGQHQTHSQGERVIENESWFDAMTDDDFGSRQPQLNLNLDHFGQNSGHRGDDMSQFCPNLDHLDPNSGLLVEDSSNSEPEMDPLGRPGPSDDNEDEEMIQSSPSPHDHTPESEVSVSEPVTTNLGYQLPHRVNRGIPPKRYRPDENGEGRYAMANFMTLSHMPEQVKEFDKVLASAHIPRNLNEALSDPKWVEAMKTEMDALEKNETWELVSRPKGRKTVGCKWVFTIKYGPTGKIDRYKARLVAKGYSQTYGVDYQETFSPVAKLNTVRVLLSIAANQDWPLHQFDVKNAFLHGDIDEEIYMDIPPGYGHSSKRPLVCRLKKALYGLKQSPRAWFGRFCMAMKGYGYTQSDADHTLFFLKNKGKLVILIIYVDDMIITGDDSEGIRDLEERLCKEFEMKNLGGLKYFLGIEVARSKEGIALSQRKYVLDLLVETGMLDCKPVDTPSKQNNKLGIFPDQTPTNKEQYQRLVGRLIYLSHTRPDIAYAVSVVSQFMHSPSEQHMEAVMWILRYLKGSPGRGIFFKKNGHLRVKGYTDSDWAGDVTDRKSTSGYFTFVGGNLVTWRSKKQKVVALSSAEAEFRGIAKGLQELLWLKRVLKDLGLYNNEEMKLFCDNKAAIAISQNPVQHDRTKHIEVDRHFIRQNLEEKVISIPYVRTEEQLADMLTKGVSSIIFHTAIDKLGMRNIYMPT